jgi:Xaa-Pro aminopeptidase
MSVRQNNMGKPSMFSLLSQNGIAGATTIRQASQGHRFPSLNPHVNRCNDCTCSPGLLSRNRRSSIYLRRMMSSSSNIGNKHLSHSGSSSPRRLHSTTTHDLLSETSNDECKGIENLNTTPRLEKLRNLMKDLNLGVYIIPSEDAHQSEYTSIVDQRREFISGFTGSAGVAIITRELASMNETPEGLAFLATDGRYFTQATNELDFNWSLLKLGTPDTPTWEQCAIDNAALLSLDSGNIVNIGIDPKLITFSEVKHINKLIEEKLKENNKFQIKLVPVRDNLIDTIWNIFEEKPIRNFKPIFKLGDKYTGETTKSKLNRLKENYLDKNNNSTLILNALDEIAWLLNIRGNDIEYNPLFYSYLIINGIDNLTLYTDKHERFNDDLKQYLKEINCELKKYDDIWFDIRKIATDLNNLNKKILLTEESSSWKMINCIIAKNFIEIESPIKLMKEIKNSIELNGQIQAQIDDGFALIKYFSWLENELIEKCSFISEYDASMKLLKIRSELNNFKGLSFETISSTGSNAAIIHYSPPIEGSSLINPNKIYLCDSGSQFLNGTTDTTRTLHFSEPNKEEIENYTLVLKGHIAISKLIIPNNKVTGFQIDCIARQFLWNKGLDYMHGTGHGVDSFGPVHSSGIGIGFRPYCNKNTLKAGHLISNEPGYYKPEEYGIRIENMVYLKEIEGKDGWLEFITTTKVPYCKKLIDVKLLNEEEKNWINQYHKSIWELYEDKFQKKSWEWQWLKRETSPL